MRSCRFAFAAALVVFAAPSVDANAHEQLIARHAAANGLPEALVRRVVHIESKGNARATSKGNYGLMQIRLGTARAMGYTGDAEGLLDADTNLTYAVRYLAGAYRAAGGSHDGAIRNYQRGYYYAAKRQGFSPYQLASTTSKPAQLSSAAAPSEPARQPAAPKGRTKEAHAKPLSLLPTLPAERGKPARKTAGRALAAAPAAAN